VPSERPVKCAMRNRILIGIEGKRLPLPGENEVSRSCPQLAGLARLTHAIIPCGRVVGYATALQAVSCGDDMHQLFNFVLDTRLCTAGQ